MSERIVVVPLSCVHCGQPMEIDCLSPPGFGHLAFYAVDCPSCEHLSHPQLPGDIVDIWRVGEREQAESN